MRGPFYNHPGATRTRSEASDSDFRPHYYRNTGFINRWIASNETPVVISLVTQMTSLEQINSWMASSFDGRLRFHVVLIDSKSSEYIYLLKVPTNQT